MGHIDEAIYSAYWAVKRNGKNIPPFPKDTVQGYLDPAGEGFALELIFLNGWDCRRQFEAATAVPGFSTKEYRATLIEELLAKHPELPLTGQTREQLLAYNPKK